MDKMRRQIKCECENVFINTTGKKMTQSNIAYSIKEPSDRLALKRTSPVTKLESCCHVCPRQCSSPQTAASNSNVSFNSNRRKLLLPRWESANFNKDGAKYLKDRICLLQQCLKFPFLRAWLIHQGKVWKHFMSLMMNKFKKVPMMKLWNKKLILISLKLMHSSTTIHNSSSWSVPISEYYRVRGKYTIARIS